MFTINFKYIEKLKSYLLTGLVKTLKSFKYLGKALKVIFKFPFTLLFFIYKYLVKKPFFLAYQILRKIKKLVLFFSFKDQSIKHRLTNYLPLLILTFIGLTIVVSNLYAQDVKSDTYGNKSLLYKMTKSSGDYWEDNILSDEIIEEGPLVDKVISNSYLDDQVLMAESPTVKQDLGINTLISTTQNESALISPDITDPDIVVKRRDQILDYVVQVGDTISTIAFKFSITTNTILWENNLSYYSTIKPGQTLKILPITGISHKIKKGDSLNSIAKTYKGNVNEIMEFNKLAALDDIQIDQQVIIPGGSKEITYVAPQVVSVKDIFIPPATVSGSKLQWPTNSYRITQYYNWGHTGLDIGNATGQPIYAAESGKVEAAGWNSGGYGYYVIINHGGGLKTLYAHLSKVYVKLGQNVQRGHVIGAIGSTGRSTGPHLHFEVRVNGIKVNPLEYIR